MTDGDLLRWYRRATWARTILLGVASVGCLLSFRGYIDGLPADAGGALLVLDALGGPAGIRLWAGLFAVAGVAGLVVAIGGWRANWLILIMGALWGFWGFVFLGAWIAGEQPRGYVTAAWLLMIDVLLSTLMLLLPARRHRD